jgi:hypothetical protein
METDGARTFRIELGVNFDAATIPRTNPNMRVFPLQNALIDVTQGESEATAQWYTRLHSGDRLSFRLVNITRIAGGSLEVPRLVELSFTDPDSGLPADPFVEVVRRWQIEEPSKPRTSPVYSYGTRDKLLSWEIAWFDGNHRSTQPLTLASVEDGYCGFELAMAVGLHRGGWYDQYVFDPEMIVGERGGPDSREPGT